jgi:DNA-binding winged helix-turn-helix (wHTH) protein
MQPAAAKTFSFEGFKLDLEHGSLCNEQGEIELRPKSFQVLRYLVGNAGRLVAKEELLQAMWPNVTIRRVAFAMYQRCSVGLGGR